jgi:ABC-type multidrug transport system ATPase subunit
MSGAVDPLVRPTMLARPAADCGAGSGSAALTEAPTARLVATGLTKSYGAAEVLRGIDLELCPTSLVAIAGGNGVGKSTLLGCLAGTLRHGGRVLLDGRPLGKATRGRVAYLPQRLRLPGSSSGNEVMTLFSSLGRSERQPIDMPPGFVPDLRKPVGQLSGGQQQRVALAAILQGSPDVVLLDEPFANLDDDARAQAHLLLQAHRDTGATVLVASPTAIDLLAMLDRVLLLEDGRIGFDGAPSGYSGRLEVTLWVRSRPEDEARIEALEHVLHLRREGAWLALECHEDRAVSLLRDLESLGVRAEDVRLGGPSSDPRLSVSPGTVPGAGAR